MSRVFSFHYSVSSADGEKIDSSEGGEPMTFIEGAGQIIPGLEKEVLQMESGQKKDVKVAAADAYGVRNEALIARVQQDKLPSPNVRVGDRFRGGPEEHAPVFTVVGIKGTEVTLDGNHPLAGKDLLFNIEVTGIREATEQELQHGHAHGAHGHDH